MLIFESSLVKVKFLTIGLIHIGLGILKKTDENSTQANLPIKMAKSIVSVKGCIN